MSKLIIKKLPFILLTFMLSTGILLPSCDNYGGKLSPCNCGAYKYFDVQNIEVAALSDLGRRTAVKENTSISLSEFAGIFVDYVTEYHAARAPRQNPNWSFSLMNSAYACTCIPGPAGSKEEKLVRFSVITLNDFDEEHKAGESINDLLTYKYFENNGADVSLEDFISTNTDINLVHEDMFLTLTKAPSLNANFHVKVQLELSTGENYEAESKVFELLP